MDINLNFYRKNNISIVNVRNLDEGLKTAKKIIYSFADRNTVLFLSGGSTPKPLYENLAKEKKLNVGAVAMADERYVAPNHKGSNEKMIRETGFISYLKENRVPFLPVLRLHLEGFGRELSRIGVKPNCEDAVGEYAKVIEKLLHNFSKRIAIMGIGEDGHTAGLPAKSQISRFAERRANLKSQKLVTEIRDFPGEFRKRITLTLKALSKMDLLIVLVFGSAKQNALEMMFRDGPIEEIPARFYTQKEIARKTLLITDQKA